MTKAYAAHSSSSPLVPHEIKRRAVGSHDVEIKILYTGICHSDIHNVRDQWVWNQVNYPMVPGHEILGKVVKVGDQVKKFKVGDRVGVGFLVDSCRECHSCKEGQESYCENGAVFTYNSLEKQTGGITYGGYSEAIVVNEDFVLNVPDGLDIKAAAPLLCAGITMYSSLRYCNVGKDTKVGIVGLGGLGHIGVKLANAMGAHVTMITTSPSKENDAKHLGAHETLLSTDEDSMNKHGNSFDVIIDTIPKQHDVNPYIQLLKRDGKMVIVGAFEVNVPVNFASLIFRRRAIIGSLMGGIKETQEMLDFCGKHRINPLVEIIKASEINEAYERMLKNDVKYRFVIDMSTI
jgi:uncharacterized zinc-type alcohol dehydrogenase-like protein